MTMIYKFTDVASNRGQNASLTVIFNMQRFKQRSVRVCMQTCSIINCVSEAVSLSALKKYVNAVFIFNA
jgi:hypothetical protein